ncbi:Alpha beta-hydrolase [Mycena indigotica]|uniref:Alpha beta-hydrolase n=1 Tax=Mycena indigotica TaxID=2126181 RepID=A0A8H6SHT5_9AGAR|nr:Alpha beta-hydrolase [Mycena indigotica]KAF7298602.1 Alpha beta-hydrolase [Mycena indigotica]
MAHPITPNPSSSPAHNASTATQDSDESDEMLVDWKAKYMALEAHSRLTKRKRSGNETQGSITQQGRGIRLLVSLFLDPAQIVVAGEAYEQTQQEPLEYDEFNDELSEEQEKAVAERRPDERLFTAYRLLLELVPGLLYQLTNCNNPDDLTSYYIQLNKGANDSRSDDIGRITRLLANLINNDRYNKEILQFDFTPPAKNQDGQTIRDQHGNTVRQYAPILTQERNNRGVQHDICGGLLSSTDCDWKDDMFVIISDPTLTYSSLSFSARIAARTFEPDSTYSASFLCRIFFQGFEFKPEDPYEGFLQSHYLVSCYKSVFLGPSSVKNNENVPPTAKRIKNNVGQARNVATRLKMNGRVTGRSVAYIAVLTHFCLTNAEQWTEEFGGFLYSSMYNFIVDYFEAARVGTAHRERVDKLLAWWDSQIFPHHPSTRTVSKTTSNTIARLRGLR